VKRQLLLAAGFVAFAAICAPASANTSCAWGMVRNTYGFVASGVTSEGVACASTGLIIIANSSAVTVKVNDSCNNGIASSYTGTGTYTLSSDCTGSATVNFSNGGTGTYKLTVVNGGGGLLLIASIPGVVLSGTAIKT